MSFSDEAIILKRHILTLRNYFLNEELERLYCPPYVRMSKCVMCVCEMCMSKCANLAFEYLLYPHNSSV